MLLEKSKILETVARQPIVGIREAQRDGSFAMRPSELAEGLPHFRRRIDAPPVFAKKISREIPGPAFRVGAAVFELPRAAAETPAAQLDRCAGTREAVLGSNRDGAAERVQ